MSEKSEAEVIGELATAAVVTTEIEPGKLYTAPNGNGSVTTIDTESYGPHPRRTAARRSLSDARSLAAYLRKHSIPGATEVYADKLQASIIAVIDSHAGTDKDAGWQEHRVDLKLEHTKSWKSWVANDGKLFSQSEFAEFIEQRATDVQEPTAGDLMSMAQTFYMTKDLEFQSTARLHDGQTELVFKEKVQTKGLGKTEIPKELLLVLQPYVAGPRQNCRANLRTRLNGSTLQIGYVLVRPEEILDGIFADIVEALRNGKAATDGWDAYEGIDAPIYYGRP